MLSKQYYTFSKDAVNALFPMQVTLNADGVIDCVGPTLERIFARDFAGHAFFECFEIEKPRHIETITDLHRATGKRLIVWSKVTDRAPIKFRCVATPSEFANGALMIDFAFGSNLNSMADELELCATDFKPNDFSLDLLYTIETQRTLFEDSQKLATQLRQSKHHAEAAAHIDHLTGVANRRGLHDYVATLLQQGETGGDFAFLHLDLDKFKTVNDNFGHAAGDVVLQHTARILRDCAGGAAFAARLGGDEFAVVIKGKFSDTDLYARAQDILTLILEPILFQGTVIQIGASIGALSFNPAQDPYAEQIFISADIALHEAKQSANAVSLLTKGMLRRHLNRAEIVQEIKRGIDADQFVPFFQPQINTKTMQIEGFEVLARWQHPERGLLPPAEFMTLAHQAKLMGAIEHSVMKQAIQCFRIWRDDGHAIAKLSFNLTAANLRSLSFVESLTDELRRAKLGPRSIVLELLESVVFEATDEILMARCEALSEAGFGLALDDFGTGHAALATLIDHPISALKIDRSFITGIDKNAKLQRITKTILAMAQQLQLKVIAEGVETAEELDVLNRFGCQFVQGYYFSAPMNAHQSGKWIRAWQSLLEGRDASIALKRA